SRLREPRGHALAGRGRRVTAPGELAARDAVEVARQVRAPVAEPDDADPNRSHATCSLGAEPTRSRADTTRSPAWPSPYSSGRDAGGMRASASRAAPASRSTS